VSSANMTAIGLGIVIGSAISFVIRRMTSAILKAEAEELPPEPQLRNLLTLDAVPPPFRPEGKNRSNPDWTGGVPPGPNGPRAGSG
jgi:hypothetical protein